MEKDISAIDADLGDIPGDGEAAVTKSHLSILRAGAPSKGRGVPNIAFRQFSVSICNGINVSFSHLAQHYVINVQCFIR